MLVSTQFLLLFVGLAALSNAQIQCDKNNKVTKDAFKQSHGQSCDAMHLYMDDYSCKAPGQYVYCGQEMVYNDKIKAYENKMTREVNLYSNNEDRSGRCYQRPMGGNTYSRYLIKYPTVNKKIGKTTLYTLMSTAAEFHTACQMVMFCGGKRAPLDEKKNQWFACKQIFTFEASTGRYEKKGDATTVDVPIKEKEYYKATDGPTCTYDKASKTATVTCTTSKCDEKITPEIALEMCGFKCGSAVADAATLNAGTAPNKKLVCVVSASADKNGNGKITKTTVGVEDSKAMDGCKGAFDPANPDVQYICNGQDCNEAVTADKIKAACAVSASIVTIDCGKGPTTFDKKGGPPKCQMTWNRNVDSGVWEAPVVDAVQTASGQCGESTADKLTIYCTGDNCHAGQTREAAAANCDFSCGPNGDHPTAEQRKEADGKMKKLACIKSIALSDTGVQEAETYAIEAVDMAKFKESAGCFKQFANIDPANPAVATYCDSSKCYENAKDNKDPIAECGVATKKCGGKTYTPPKSDLAAIPAKCKIDFVLDNGQWVKTVSPAVTGVDGCTESKETAMTLFCPDDNCDSDIDETAALQQCDWETKYGTTQAPPAPPAPAEEETPEPPAAPEDSGAPAAPEEPADDEEAEEPGAEDEGVNESPSTAIGLTLLLSFVLLQL